MKYFAHAACAYAGRACSVLATSINAGRAASGPHDCKWVDFNKSAIELLLPAAEQACART